MTATPRHRVGLVWFREETYAASLRMLPDARDLPKTWAEWHASALRGELRMQGRGLATVRAYIDPRPFKIWCRMHGVAADANGRMLFAASVSNGAKAPVVDAGDEGSLVKTQLHQAAC